MARKQLSDSSENRLKATLSDSMSAISTTASALPQIALSGAKFLKGTAPVVDTMTMAMLASTAIAQVELEETLTDMEPRYKSRYDELLAKVS